MPVTLTYFLTASKAIATAADTDFPASGAKLACDVSAYDQQFFLDVVDRLLPPEYIEPVRLNPQEGYEIFQAIAKVAERISQAITHVACGLVSLYADDPTYATVLVTFYRENFDAGAVTVKANTLVTASKSGRAFKTTQDAVFGANDLFVSVYAQAIAPGYEYNVPGQFISAGGEIVDGEIDTIQAMLQEPAYGDPSIRVKQPFDAEGGTSGFLEGHAANHGLTRADGESANALRLRIRTLPDTITPAAFRRIISRILDPLGLTYTIYETWSTDYMTCWDCPSPNPGTPTYQASIPSNLNTNLFFYDHTGDSYVNRWLSADDYRGSFIVVIDLATVADTGFAWDDDGVAATDYFDSSTGRYRGMPVWDGDATKTSENLFQGVFDGTDTAIGAVTAALLEALNEAKAAGFSAIVDYNHDW